MSFISQGSGVTPPTPDIPESRLLTRRDNEPFRVSAPRLAHRSNPPRRRARLALRIAIAFVLVVCAMLLGSAIWLRHAMHASLPQIDGSLRLPGLSAPVTVTRDDHGIPSITAANLDDLLFAQGYVTAQDRLWQMDATRRHAAGELAEILGSGLVLHDRTQRTLQLRAAAERSIAVLPPDQLHQLEAYARGVNAFINQNADHLPVEFHLLHYKPAPWTPRDSLLIALAMFQDLSTEYPSKLQRETLSAHLPADLLPDLYPVGAWRDHPPGQGAPDLTSPRPEIEQVPLDESQSRLSAPTVTPGDLLEAQAASFQLHCDGCRAGSNNWTVAGARSASGRPLLSNDMHLALNLPGIWYEASLHTVDNALDVAGVTLPGAPFVIVGRNEHVAWGFTNLGGDTQEIYIEHTRGAGATMEFQRADGMWTPVAHHAEQIRIRGSSDITLDVLTTTHTIGSTPIATPIISPLYPTEKRVLSLAWTAYDPANVSEPFLHVNDAADGASIVAALNNWGGPTQNLVYADDHNHIGYHAMGRIPIRGPAVHHPIAAQTPTPEGPPPTDEGEASAEKTPTAHLILAAYRPPSKRSRKNAKPSPKQIRTPTPKPAPKPVEAPIPAPPPPLAYTIGSPIAPGPVDALDPNAQWTAYIPFSEMPSVIDPPDGVLATANARITPDGYPYNLTLNWAAPYRVERINRLLANRTGLTPADMLRTQMDIHSEYDLALAQHIVYALDHTPATAHNAKRLHEAADILRNWNGNMDAGSAAASIVFATRTELWPMLLIPQITTHDQAANMTRKDIKPEAIAKLYAWGEQSFALEQLVQNQPKRWLPSGIPDWNTLLATAVDHGLTSANAPTKLATWNYANAHPVEINHPVLSMSPLFSRLLGVPVNSGQRYIGGDTSTIKATSHSAGPSERFTADLSDPDATTANLPAGQSGNPASPWYLDQLPLWLSGATLPLPLHNAPVRHTLTLTP